MTLSVRPVHHESENQEFLRVLRSNLPSLPHERRFDWLYRSNPDGHAWSWFAFQGTPERVVGVASVFPRMMWIGEELRLCGQVGDFGISAGYRSLGPALLLQRNTFGPVDQGTLAFCYDCPPHQAGMSTFRRLGMHPDCRVDRYALVLRVDGRVRKRLGLASALPAAVGNLLLRLHRLSTLKSKTSGLEISDHTGAFGEEFSQLDASVKKSCVIRGQRSATHLNWRYREDPLQQYQVLTARRNGQLIAFVVLSTTSEVVTIVDLFGGELHDVTISLLAAIIERFQSSHQTVEAFLSEGNELIRHFLKMRFRLRSEAAQVVAYAKPRSKVSEFLDRSPSWAFTQADIRA